MYCGSTAVQVSTRYCWFQQIGQTLMKVWFAWTPGMNTLACCKVTRSIMCNISLFLKQSPLFWLVAVWKFSQQLKSESNFIFVNHLFNIIYFSFRKTTLRFVSGFHLHQMPTGVWLRNSSQDLGVYFEKLHVISIHRY